MVAITVMTAAGTLGVAFSVRFSVALCKECRHHRIWICYLVRIRRGSDKCVIPNTREAGRIDSPNCLTLIALRPARCGMSVSAANRTIRLPSGAGLGSAAVLLVSYCSFRFHFNLPTAGFVDLLIVVVTALNFRFFEATGSSLAGRRESSNPVEDERSRGSFRLISWRAGRTRSPSHVVPGVSTSPASGMCSVYRTRLR